MGFMITLQVSRTFQRSAVEQLNFGGSSYNVGTELFNRLGRCNNLRQLIMQGPIIGGPLKT